MPNYNLGAIWGPSLLTVDSMEASTYAQTSSESDVCRDLIDNYMFIFDVAEEELEKEAKISETLEKINKHDRGRQALKRSGLYHISYCFIFFFLISKKKNNF